MELLQLQPPRASIQGGEIKGTLHIGTATSMTSLSATWFFGHVEPKSLCVTN
jgi:hypothetical protein